MFPAAAVLARFRVQGSVGAISCVGGMQRLEPGVVPRIPNFDQEDASWQDESSHAEEWEAPPPEEDDDVGLPLQRTPGPSQGERLLETPPPVDYQRRVRLKRNWAGDGLTEQSGPAASSAAPEPDGAAVEAEAVAVEDGEAAAEVEQPERDEQDAPKWLIKTKFLDAARNQWVKDWLQQKNAEQGFFSLGTTYLMKRTAARAAWQNLSPNDKEAYMEAFDLERAQPRGGQRCTKHRAPRERVGGQLHTFNVPVMDIPALAGSIQALKDCDVDSKEFKAAMVVVASHPTIMGMWEDFKKKYKKACGRLPDVCDVSLCAEISLHARGASTSIRIHFHGAVSNLKQKQIPNYSFEDWEVNGVFPDVQPTQGRGRYAIQAIHRMHMYVQLKKIGHLYTDTNIPMYRDSTVQPKWLMELWQQRKLDMETLRASLLESRGKCINEFNFLDWWDSKMLDAKARAAQAEVQKKLQHQLKRFKTYPNITMWLKQYWPINYGKSFRFRFLVMEGPSSVGKTVLAKSFFSPDKTYYYNMQTAAEPDLRGFRVGHHRACVFDEITWQQVVKLKVLFQAGVDGADLGASQCNQYSYWRFLYGVAIICCTNEWLPPKRAERSNRRGHRASHRLDAEDSPEEEVLYKGPDVPDRDREWLETNSIYQEIKSPVWFEE